MTAQVGITVALACCFAAVFISLFTKDYTFAYQGLLGAVLGEGQTADFSVLETVSLLGNSSQLASTAVIVYLTVLVSLSVLALPLLWILLSLIIWLVPLTPRAHRYLLNSIEVCAAWSMLDVFVVMMLSSMLELDKFAQYIVQDECWRLNDVLAYFPQLSDLLPGEPVCLGIVPSLTPPFWLLTAGTLISVPFSLIVMAAASGVYEEGLKPTYRPLSEQAPLLRVATRQREALAQLEVLSVLGEGDDDINQREAALRTLAQVNRLSSHRLSAVRASSGTR